VDVGASGRQGDENDEFGHAACMRPRIDSVNGAF
jgi:hypothetical protein